MIRLTAPPNRTMPMLSGYEWFSAVGVVASLLGLIISTWTLVKVGKLPAALKRQSRHRDLTELIDKINRIPSTKPSLADSTTTEVEIVLWTIRLDDVSKMPFRHRSLKAVIRNLEAELKGQKCLGVVQQQLRLLRDEITLR